MASNVAYLSEDASSLNFNPLCEHDYFIKVCDYDHTNDHKLEKGDDQRKDQEVEKEEEEKDELLVDSKIKKEIDYLLSLVHRLKEIDFTLKNNDINSSGGVESGSTCKVDNEETENEKDIDVSVREWPWIDQSLCKSKTSCIPMTAYDEEHLMKRLSITIEDAHKKNKRLPTDTYLMYRRLHVRKLKRDRNMKVFNFDEHLAEVLPSDKCRYVVDKYYDSYTVQLPRDNILSSGPYPDLSSIVSPYTNRELKPFIWCDVETKPPWLKMLKEIKQRQRNDGCEDIVDVDHSAPICYSYIRPEHITAINSLCSIYFWPGIDLSESVQYPDFSCIALYKKLIVGFALMVPDVTATDSYISFLLTRAGWRNSGIATFMLYHLIQTCMGKDITLHVAADNPSLFLYQKFGFKVEQFVKNFYDKYLPLSSRLCKHALFLRLSR